MDITSLLEDLRDFSQKEKYQVYHLAAGTDEDHVQTLDPIPSNYAQDTFSIAKVYTMTAIGLLYDRGLVRIDEKICDILGDLVPKDLPDKRWRDVTVEMALTHRAGLPVGNLDIDCNPPRRSRTIFWAICSTQSSYTIRALPPAIRTVPSTCFQESY